MNRSALTAAAGAAGALILVGALAGGYELGRGHIVVRTVTATATRTATVTAMPKVITRVRTKTVTRTVPGPPSIPCFEENGRLAGVGQPSGAGTGPPVQTTCTIVLRTAVPASNDQFYAVAPDGSTLNLQVVP